MTASVRALAPTSAGSAAVPPENRNRKNTGRNEISDSTTRSIGSRRSGRESRRPMYHAWRRRLLFNGSPHELDERILERRRLERHASSVVPAPRDDREALRVRLRLEDLPVVTVRLRGFDDHAHPRSRHRLRLLHGPEERELPLLDDRKAGAELLRLVHVVRRQEGGHPFRRQAADHRPPLPAAEGGEPDRPLGRGKGPPGPAAA